MIELHVGQSCYRLTGLDTEIALAHAIGSAFLELQKLEFSIISYLDILAGGAINADATFDLFASKTFGNLLREMQKHELLRGLAADMRHTKERRDFFVHKFLFHRYAGGFLTTHSEYNALILEAHDLCALFAEAQIKFSDLMLDKAPVVMFGAKIDSATGEWVIVESKFARGNRDNSGSNDAESGD